MYRKFLLCLCLSLLSPMSQATEMAAPAPSLADHRGEEILLFEGLTLFNSELAAVAPQATGGIILVTAPLALAEDHDHGAQAWVGASGYAALGVFDVSQPPTYSRGRLFAENFAIWNLWGGTMLLMEHGSGGGVAAKLARHMSVTPKPHGGARLDYHWTF